MKRINLLISFEDDKLRALRFYMEKKELNVEDELQAQLARLYEKMVPVQVREYIESQSESEIQKQEGKVEEDTVKQEIKSEGNTSEQGIKADGEKPSEKQPRQTKRQREKELVAAQPELKQEQLAETEEAEEESQGMSMSM